MSGDHNLFAQAEQAIVSRHGGFVDKIANPDDLKVAADPFDLILSTINVELD